MLDKEYKAPHAKYDFAADIKASSRMIAVGIAGLVGVLLVEYSAAAVVAEVIDHPVKWSIVGLVIFYFVSVCRPARPHS